LGMSMLVAVPASAAVWSTTHSCQSPFIQTRLASTSTGFTTHFRNGVTGPSWGNPTATYRTSFWGLGSAAYKIEAPTIHSQNIGCIGA
jgi:hypothetical protein